VARVTWRGIARRATPDVVAATVLCGITVLAVAAAALEVGARVNPAVGWLLVAVAAGAPAAAIVRSMITHAQLERERRAATGRTEHSRVEEALGPVESSTPSGWDDEDGPARAPRPGWRT